MVVLQEELLKKAVKVDKVLPMPQVVAQIEPKNAGPAAHKLTEHRWLALNSVL